MADRPHLLVYALRGSLEGALSAADNGFLDPAVWSALPDHLIERVLLVLPRGVQHRFRLVCKKWLALLTSPRFVWLSDSLAPPLAAPLVCAFEYWNGVEPETRMYSPNPNRPCTRSSLSESALGKAYRLDLSYLPQKFHEWFEMWGTGDKRAKLRRDARTWELRRDYSSQICGSAGGLIYILNDDDGWELKGQRILSVCVLNPFTRTWRELPQLLIFKEWTCWTVKLEVDEPDGSGFRFTAVCGSNIMCMDYRVPFNWSVYVYSSAEEKSGWEVTIGQPASEWPKERVLGGGFMYGYQIASGGLVVYSLLDGCLVSREGYPSALHRQLILDERISRPFHPYAPRPSLLEHLGSVYLVRDFFDPQEEWQIGIWKLDQDISEMQWELRSVFPRDLLDFGEGTRKSRLPLESFDAVVIGDEIFFMLPVMHVCRNSVPALSSSLVAFNLRDEYWQLVTDKMICLTVASGRSFALFEPKFNLRI